MSAAISPSAGFHIAPITSRTTEHPGWQESHLTLAGPPDERELRSALDELPGDAAATIVGADLFGTREQILGMEKIVRRAGITAPITPILSTSPHGGGMQMTAVAGVDLIPLPIDGGIAGYRFETAGARYCILGGLTPSDARSPRERQTGEVFSTIEKALALAHMDFRHVARTWFYNDRILEWYPGFNAVRTGYFQRHGIRRMPASTGIGAPNPRGMALTAKAVAVLPSVGGDVRVRTVRSPLQCDAFAYGSAFSRAIEVEDPRSRTLSISGTASIEPGGKSVHQDDPAAQIELTMRVVGGILDEAGMRLEDTTRAVAYFRDPSDIPLWEDYCGRHDIPPLPLLAVGCHVCRDDLLFEIELDVSSPRSPH